MAPLIIGMAGRKQSGKGTACKFLTANAGFLWSPQLGTVYQDGKFVDAAGPKVRTFSMAGPIKRLCIDILGLAPEQVYGTNEQKNSPTRYLWQNLPHYRQVVIEALEKKVIPEMAKTNGGSYFLLDWQVNAVVECGAATWLTPESQLDKLIDQHVPWGHMTGREVMQQVGTGMFRCLHPNIWAEACLREINASGVDVAFIDDMRFPTEVEEVHKNKGTVFRFTRVAFPDDTHESETALDPGVYDWSNFDGIVDNQHMGQRESCRELVRVLYESGCIHRAVKLCECCSGLDPDDLDYSMCGED